MRKIITSLTIFTFFLTGSLNAQNNIWSLEDCISYAMDNNISIKQTELNSEYYKNQYNQAKLNRLPYLNASVSNNTSFGKSLDYTTYQFTDGTNNFYSGISSGTTLFNGLQQKNTIDKSHLDLLASLENTAKIRNDISLNIAAAYLQILFSQELLNIAKNQLEITSQQIDRTQKMVDAGKLARGSALEIQAQYAGEELSVISAENDLIMAYLNLQLMLDLPYDPSFSIVVPDLSEPENSFLMTEVSEIYSSAEQRMPQVKSSEYSLGAAEKDLAIARGGRYPSLSLSASSYSRYNNKAIDYSPTAEEPYTFSEQFNDNFNYGFGLELNIPIFNRYQVKTNISNARISIESAELDLQNTKNELYRSIQQAYLDAVGALKKYNSTQKALIAMEESFKYTEKKFEVGLVNTVDYNTSKNQLTKTQSDLLQAKYDFIFKTKILHFYKGDPITL